MVVFDASDLGPTWELYEHAYVEDNDCEDRVYQFRTPEWDLWIIASRALSASGHVVVSTTFASLDAKYGERSDSIPEHARPDPPPLAEAHWYHDPTPRAPTACTLVFRIADHATAVMTLRPTNPSEEITFSAVLQELSRVANVFADVLVRASPPASTRDRNVRH